MSNNYFRFKQFTIHQDLCAMKVGTDGTLLGAWANGGERILDIGTGTGLIALMMAQRFPKAKVTAIDIDDMACQQAQQNIALSPFDVEVQLQDVLNMQGAYDCLVCNPPFFITSLECPDEHRAIARHASNLTYRKLIQSARRLLTDDGEFSLIIPADTKHIMEMEASLVGFFKSRECAVKTTPQKAPKRYLLAFVKHCPQTTQTEEGIIEISPNVRSEWYQHLTADFYL